MAHPKSIDKLTLRDMMLNLDIYSGLSDGLSQLPLPENIRIGRKKYPIPQSMEEFTDKICYGQRIFLTRKEENDFGLIVRVMDGYYYPLVTNKKWDADDALLFGKIVITCKAEKLYPVAMHLTKLINEMSDREQKLLHREPSKMELAAGIEKLNVFSEMTSLHFLRDAMKITVPEVLLTPYNECLVHFMIAKEQAQFQERYFELMKETTQPKPKYHGQT
jgi:hypothetical protein